MKYFVYRSLQKLITRVTVATIVPSKPDIIGIKQDRIRLKEIGYIVSTSKPDSFSMAYSASVSGGLVLQITRANTFSPMSQ